MWIAFAYWYTGISIVCRIPPHVRRVALRSTPPPSFVRYQPRAYLMREKVSPRGGRVSPAKHSGWLL